MTYTKNVWSTGDTITATLANHWETQYDAAMADMSSSGNAATATSAGELSDYNGGHTIKATWTGSAVEFEVDSSANEPVEQAVNATNATNANYATNAGTASNSNALGGQAPSYYATASSASAAQSASGVWTPGAGTFNVAAGTVINIAAVPSGAKSFNVTAVSGNESPLATLGFMTASGATWISTTGPNSTAIGAAAGVSSTSYTYGGNVGGSGTYLYDGSYYCQGYFQLNGGYLQLVITNAGAAAAYTAETFRWAVS